MTQLSQALQVDVTLDEAVDDVVEEVLGWDVEADMLGG